MMPDACREHFLDDGIYGMFAGILFDRRGIELDAERDEDDCLNRLASDA